MLGPEKRASSRPVLVSVSDSSSCANSPPATRRFAFFR